MITDVIVSSLMAGLSALLGLFPTVSDTVTDTTGVASFASNVVVANAFAPVQELFFVAGALLVMRLALQSWVVIVWVYHQFWGSS